MVRQMWQTADILQEVNVVLSSRASVVMTQSVTHFWPWSVEMFGNPGVLLVLLVGMITVISAVLTLVYVWRLNAKINNVALSLMEFTYAQSRQQQVERLQRDRNRDRKKPRRRR
ncbi:hypothetical protein C2W62_36950 [Candidatus Entotheonella serta]|nr:hypothetical protein C2W62_36950 [Candidatus Entotheonella serta]